MNTNQEKKIIPSVSRVQLHTHNDNDSPKLNPATSLLGFPIMTSVPTDTPLEGTFRFAVISGVPRIYGFINGTWSYRTLNDT